MMDETQLVLVMVEVQPLLVKVENLTCVVNRWGRIGVSKGQV